MKKLLAFSWLLILCAFGSLAMTWLPAEMPNVQVADRRQYVSDPGNLLSPAVKSEVNDMLASLRARTSVEMVVALPPNIGDEEPQVWTEALFSLWKIGKADNDNGLLLMISPESRAAFIMPGYGCEGVLTDIACGKIYRNVIVPCMKKGDLDGAVLGSVKLIVSALEDPAVADELRSSQSDLAGGGSVLDINVFLSYIWGVAAVLFFVALIYFFTGFAKARKRRDNYGKAESWRSMLKPMAWLSLFTAGAALILLAASWLIYRFWRTRRLKCPTCGARMHRLPEDKDNELLSDSQDFEEKIGTVDYDVWECPDCGTIDRYAYRADQKKYTECPSCHTVAMCLVSDLTTRQPTVRTEGEGMKIYECRYCGHRTQKRYRIPRKEDPSAALAAAAVLGAAASRGRGGGGFGGGFGGGSTGGGGAGGRW